MFIPLLTWNNLLKRLNPTEEQLYCTALLIELEIKPDWPPSFRLSAGSPIDRDITLDSPFSVVLTKFPGIVGRIRGNDCGAILNLGNLKCFEGWFVEP
jgi:hypothetical protein